MKILSQRKFIPIFIFLIAGVILLTLIVMPSEQSLGNVIKLVFLHAAFVQVGLITFAVAAIWAISYLFKKNEKYYQFCLASQKTALVIWILYVFSSMLVTYWAWGKVIAWEEPRVQSSALILGLAVLLLFLVNWIKNQRFTAFANLMMAVFAWGLTKQAGIVQHPLNPIGESNSASLKVYLLIMMILVLLLAVQISRVFYKPPQKELKNETS